jgi:hypothetical protein
MLFYVLFNELIVGRVYFLLFMVDDVEDQLFPARMFFDEF